MNRKCVCVVLSIVFACLFSACSTVKPPVNDLSGEISNEINTTDSSELSSVDDSKSSSVEQDYSGDFVESKEDIVHGKGLEDYKWHYPNELYDLIILADITDWKEVEKYAEEEYKFLYPDGLSQLPPIYEFIKRFEINRDDFVEANKKNSNYTDKQIELMFGDYEENIIMQELKLDTTFYCDGVIYNIFEICKMDKATLEAISSKSELIVYLNKMKDLLKDYSYQVEDIAETLNKLQH